MAARITQHFVEVLRILADPPVQVSQEWIEVLRYLSDPPVQVTQEWIEVLRYLSDPPVRVSQEFVEVLVGTFAGTRVTQEWIEVLLVPAGLPPIEWALLNDTAQTDNISWDFPWELSTTVGAATVLGTGESWNLSNTTGLSAASGGDFEGDDGEPEGEFLLVTLTTVGGQLLSSAPDIQSYTNVTYQSNTYSTNFSMTFMTVTGASGQLRMLVDGRTDLIGTRRYRR